MCNCLSHMKIYVTELELRKVNACSSHYTCPCRCQERLVKFIPLRFQMCNLHCFSTSLLRQTILPSPTLRRRRCNPRSQSSDASNGGLQYPNFDPHSRTQFYSKCDGGRSSKMETGNADGLPWVGSSENTEIEGERKLPRGLQTVPNDEPCATSRFPGDNTRTGTSSRVVRLDCDH